jgi:hypothetical protein
MDDLAPAPAPAQRTSDDVGRKPEEILSSRKKAPKKARPVPAKEQNPEARTESDHQLDVLA